MSFLTTISIYESGLLQVSVLDQDSIYDFPTKYSVARVSFQPVYGPCFSMGRIGCRIGCLPTSTPNFHRFDISLKIRSHRATDLLFTVNGITRGVCMDIFLSILTGKCCRLRVSEWREQDNFHATTFLFLQDICLLPRQKTY